MNDIKYTFVEDSRDKKRTATGAKHRVGLRSGCTLPHELMSKEERKKYMEASGVTIYTLRPMPLKEFKTLTADKQVELLKHYGEKYGWNAAGVAAALDTSYQTGVKLLEKYMLDKMFKARMKECTLEQKNRFITNRKELEASRNEPVSKEPSKALQEPSFEENILTLPEEEKPTQKLSEPSFGGLEINLTADKDGWNVARQLGGIAAALEAGTQYRIRLSIIELTPDSDQGVSDVADA